MKEREGMKKERVNIRGGTHSNARTNKRLMAYGRPNKRASERLT